MGRPMAKNLIAAGYSLIVFDKFAGMDDLVALGAERGNSNRDLASKSDIIITMLPNFATCERSYPWKRRSPGRHS